MSSISKITKNLVLPISATTLVLVSCSSQTHIDNSAEAVATDVENAAPVKKIEMQTAKPGAAVSISHDLAEPLTSGASTAFQVKLREGYDSGTLKVTLSADEELNLGLTTRTHRFDMAGEDEHLIDVTVTGYLDGRHYVNVLAEVEMRGGRTQSRVQSIAVQVGDDVTVTKAEPSGKVETSEDGETVIMMEAEEIIE